MTGSCYEVAVIGGGIVGSFTAYFLGKAGVKTCVIEREFPAAGTSGAGLAWVFTSLKPPLHYALMHQQSARLYDQLAQEHGVDFQLDRCGSLWVVWDEQEWIELCQEVAALKDGGIDVELLTPAEAHRLEPILDPTALVGAAYGRRDGSVNPFLANLIMSQLAQKNGVTWYNYTRVSAIEAVGSRYRLLTTGPVIEADKVVVAAGIWSREIGDMLDFKMPIIPVRGQILVSAPVQKGLVTRAIGNVFIRQHREKGSLLLGSLQEHGQDVNVSTLEGIRSIAATVLRVAPSLRHVPVIRAFSGVRPIPFDGFPLLGEIPGRPGVYTAITHSGFSLAPMVGLVTSELITGKTTSFDISNYLISRVLHVEDPFAAAVKIR